MALFPYEAHYADEDVVGLVNAIAPIWRCQPAEVQGLDLNRLWQTLRRVIGEWRSLRAKGAVDRNLQALLTLAAATSWFTQFQVKEIDALLQEMLADADDDLLVKCAEADVKTAEALLDGASEEGLAEAHRTAVVLHEQGRTSAAMDLYRKTIEKLQPLGPSEAIVNQAQNNLAVLLEDLGQFEEAEKLHGEVCERLEAKLGQEHQDVLSSKFNRAALQAKQGRFQEAEALYRQVAEVREKALGASHSDTMRVWGNLAEMLRRQGRLREALDVLQSLVDQRHATLGRDDSATLKTRTSLALVLGELGDTYQAEAHLREVVTLKEQTLGQGHPDTLAALSRVAFLLEQKQHVEAEQLHEEVWKWLDAAAPPERRRARSRQGSFVTSIQESGEPGRAGTMLRQVAERRREVLGEAHPDALAAQAELAAWLARHGEPDVRAKGLALQREIANLCESKLGPCHVDTLAARTALAGSLVRSASDGQDNPQAMHLETVNRFSAVAAATGYGDVALQAGASGARLPTGKLAVILRD